MSEKKNITIIGNGFDMNLNFESSYKNFMDYIESSEHLTGIEEKYEFNQLFVQAFNGKELNWCDFEFIFEKQIIEINESEDSRELGYTKEFLINRVNQDIKKLEQQFYEYLTEKSRIRIDEILAAIKSVKDSDGKDKIVAKEKTNSFYEKLFELSDTIINFNYTPTIEKLFPNTKEKLFHIHGTLENNNIIFGGGFSGTQLIKENAVKGSTENDKLIRSKKNSEIARQRLEISKRIDDFESPLGVVSILGHSIIGSDFVFLKPLIERAEEVYIFYYQQDYEEKFQFLVNHLSKENIEKINLAPMFNILLPNSEEKIAISQINGEGNYEVLKDVFNFPIPLPYGNREKVEFFEDFEIPNDSWLLKQIGNIRIDRQVY